MNAAADDVNQPELDARLLSELRGWRAMPSTVVAFAAGKGGWLSADEIDLLLRIADERDTLRRQSCEMPDDRPSYGYVLPAGFAFVHGEVVKLGPVGALPPEPTELPQRLGHAHEWGPAAVCSDVEDLATACVRCGMPLVPMTAIRYDWREALPYLRARTDCDA